MAAGVQPVWVSQPRARSDLRISGKSVVGQADAIHGLISRQSGERAANLFAYPRTNADGAIEWIDRLGATQSVALAQLPDAQRQAAEAELRARLGEVERLSSDPQLGGHVLGALSVESPDAIRVADG